MILCIFKGGFWGFFLFTYVIQHCFICRHCAGGCWDWTQDCYRLWHWQPDALTLRLDLIHKSRLDLIHRRLDLIHNSARSHPQLILCISQYVWLHSYLGNTLWCVNVCNPQKEKDSKRVKRNKTETYSHLYNWWLLKKCDPWVRTVSSAVQVYMASFKNSFFHLTNHL